MAGESERKYPRVTPAQLALIEAGRLRADREWLLKDIEAIQDGTAPDAWRNLLAVARWMRAQDKKREVAP